VAEVVAGVCGFCVVLTLDREPSWITSRQIEATRRTITRYTKRGGKLWIKIFPDKSVTARAAESRMGAGKGAVDYWVATVKPGTVIFELGGVPLDVAQVAMKLAAYKLPIKTKFIIKEGL
jgi:large subunit ribosomal protein L16